MKPRKQSKQLLGVTRSKAKMYEYEVLQEDHITLYQDPAKLFSLTIGILGDIAYAIVNDLVLEQENEQKKTLFFSAQFFDSYYEAKLNIGLNSYLCLVGSAAYYLSDTPGSSLVLAGKIDPLLSLDGNGLENLLLWLLLNNLESPLLLGDEYKLYKSVNLIADLMSQYYLNGTNFDRLIQVSLKLRNDVYSFGSSRELLFADLIAAIVKTKIRNSTWLTLPKYSEIEIGYWESIIKKPGFLKEFWPAQHLIGSKGILKGKSAVIQLPTSAGKTKSTELIIRSSIFRNNTKLVVIIAPFRSLCHEIKNTLQYSFKDEDLIINELTDAIQNDFELEELKTKPNILIVTPEKFLYLLHLLPSITDLIGLVLFDEGHQFDNGVRGVTYELLLTSLKLHLSENTQKVLISAVIKNSRDIAEWLNGTSEIVEGANLLTTTRSIGFVSWQDKLGRIEFIDNNTEQGDFYVPRIINSINLGKIGRERKERFFPTREDGKSIALFLGIKLVKNGGTAIFCGTKEAAVKISEIAIDTIRRNLTLNLPIKFSDENEIIKLTYLYSKNLGDSSINTICAANGIFLHHASVPQGIRSAVEFAMQRGLIRFVICTSTLAQGVNLPLRYLIVTGLYQGQDKIKVRDFHNLIGRAGRSGMFTEGSIIFSDANLFDKRKIENESWRWNQAKDILNSENSEPCRSNLLGLFTPIENDNKSREIVMKPLSFTRLYIKNPDNIKTLALKIHTEHKSDLFSLTGVQNQIKWKMNIIASIENFLLANVDFSNTEDFITEVITLSKSTLGFYLANDKEKEQLILVFCLLAENIANLIPEPEKRQKFGRSLYGLQDSIFIENWVKENTVLLLNLQTDDEFINLLWPLLIKQINTQIFQKFDNNEVLKHSVLMWISGSPYFEILNFIIKSKTKMISGTQKRDFKIEHIIEVFEKAISFDAMLIMNAISEFILIEDDDTRKDFTNRINLFQKKLKYGINTVTAISAYELGFSDRIICQSIAKEFGDDKRRSELINTLKINREDVINLLKEFPSYFMHIANRYFD